MKQPELALCVALIVAIPTLAAHNEHREQLRPKTTSETIACGSAFAVWDRWNDYGPHDETPPEADQRRALETCLKNARADATAHAAREAEASARTAQEQHAEEQEQRESENGAAAALGEAASALRAQQESGAAKSDETASEIDRLRRDPKARATAASAWICWYAVLRTWAKKEIDTEKRYAREGGGVVDMTKILSLQNSMREADEGAASQRATLKGLRARATACSEPQIRRSVECIRREQAGEPVGAVGSDGSEDECDRPLEKVILFGDDAR